MIEETLEKAIKQHARIKLYVATPATLLPAKICLLMAFTGADLYAPIANLSLGLAKVSMSRGDIVDFVTYLAVFTELAKAARIDRTAQVNFVLGVLLTIALVVMMAFIPASINIYSIKLTFLSLATNIVQATTRLAVARRDVSIGA